MNTCSLTTTQTNAWTAFQRMRTRLTGQINRELARETGLSEADFEILAALVALPDEPVRALLLRCGIDWEKSRLSHQLRRMEQRGLVIRESCAEDNRGAVVRITAAGRTLAEAAQRVHDQAVHRYVCGVLTQEQLDALGQISEAILASLDEAPPSHQAPIATVPAAHR
jgi:DNA-binding MarR family transcriptional regulator